MGSQVVVIGYLLSLRNDISRSFCHLTGIMIDKGNHPNMAKLFKLEKYSDLPQDVSLELSQLSQWSPVLAWCYGTSGVSSHFRASLLWACSGWDGVWTHKFDSSIQFWKTSLAIPEEPRTHEIAGTWKNTMFSQKTRCFWFSMFSDLFAISHAIMILIIFDMIHLILSPCIPKPWVYTSTEHYTKPFWPPGVNRKCKMLQQIRMECMGLHLAHAESDVSN